MAIISATTLLRTISIFHITVAYYLLFSPSTIADQNLVYILGAAMDIVRSPSHPIPSLFSYPPTLHSPLTQPPRTNPPHKSTKIQPPTPALRPLHPLHPLPRPRPRLPRLRPARLLRPHGHESRRTSLLPLLEQPSSDPAGFLPRHNGIQLRVEAGGGRVE